MIAAEEFKITDKLLKAAPHTPRLGQETVSLLLV